MRTTVQMDKTCCTGCGACISVCPKQAIQMKMDDEGFYYPSVNENCIGCNRCESICPTGKLSSHAILSVLGGWNEQADVREKSSSGGIFSSLAEKTIKNGGIVFGAVMNERNLPEHIGVFDRQQIKDMQGSKYVQSYSADALFHAADLVKKGIPVLFSGTPCQIAGLNALLAGHPDNLITVDFVCHGAPSPGVFSSYLTELGKNHDGVPVKTFRFRDKRLGWKNFSTVAVFQDEQVESGTQTTDPFMRGFLNNLYLRPSCHTCHVRGTNSAADITMGDLWGAHQVYPDKDDDRGLSLILVHTERGKRFLNECESLKLFPVDDLNLFKRFNPSIFEPATAHPKREKFFAIYHKRGFESATITRLLAPPGRFERACNRIRHLPKAILRRLPLGKRAEEQ